MRKIVLAFGLIGFFFACGDQVVQRPVVYHNDDFMKRSQERGKLLLAEENEWFKEYRDKSALTFSQTSMGFWISNSAIASEDMAKQGDFISYDYQVKNLDNSLIYSYQENGLQKAVLGKVDLPRGLHAALQLISANDSATILLPSFLAYGGFGDQKKIDADTPVIMEIKVHEIRKK